MVVKRGLPDSADVNAFLAAGYSERQILEVVLAIAVKTLSNYANRLFHTPVDGRICGAYVGGSGLSPGLFAAALQPAF